MKYMRLLFVVVIAGTFVGVLSVSKGLASTVSLTVIEHAETDTTTDTGKPGDSVGDILTFANKVFDGKNEKQLGTDNGFCLRTVAGEAYECNWTAFLADGQITAEGPFYDTKIRSYGYRRNRRLRWYAWPAKAPCT